MSRNFVPILIPSLGRCYPPFEHREGWGSLNGDGPEGGPASPGKRQLKV